MLNEGNAVFCEPGDLEEWEGTLVSLLKDDRRRRALGAQARRDVAGYTWVARAERALTGFI